MQPHCVEGSGHAQQREQLLSWHREAVIAEGVAHAGHLQLQVDEGGRRKDGEGPFRMAQGNRLPAVLPTAKENCCWGIGLPRWPLEAQKEDDLKKKPADLLLPQMLQERL